MDADVMKRILFILFSLILCAGLLSGYQSSMQSQAVPDHPTCSLPYVTAPPTLAPLEDEVVLSPPDVTLNLPDTYCISYQVADSGNGFRYSMDTGNFSFDFHLGDSKGERTYTQTLIKVADDGYALELGDTGEKLVFSRLDSGKYLMYRYHADSGTYVCDALTSSVQQQIDDGVMTLDMIAVDQNVVDGYTARVSACFTFYSRLQNWFDYLGVEAADGIECFHYSGTVSDSSAEQTVEVWIDQQTGICRRGIYSRTDASGNQWARKIQCLNFTPDDAVLPDVTS